MTAAGHQRRTLAGASDPGDKVLLISGTEVGKRVAQHQAVVDAARTAGVALLAYTSILHAPQADFILGRDHQAAEESILGSGLPFGPLRNGISRSPDAESPRAAGSGRSAGWSSEPSPGGTSSNDPVSATNDAPTSTRACSDSPATSSADGARALHPERRAALARGVQGNPAADREQRTQAITAWL